MAFIRTYFLHVTLGLSLFLFFNTHANAADLIFSQSAGTYSVGQSFKVNISIVNNDTSINAVSAKISFPTDQLKITSVSKVGSILNLWAEEPTYSNAAGTLSLEGVTLGGYDNPSGKILSITFLVKDTGTANLKFNSGSVLANDGKGTNVINSFGGAKYTLTAGASKPASVVEEEAPVISGNAPQITSKTHPDQSMWYPSGEVSFEWNLPADITSVRLGLDTNVRGSPKTVYSPAISNKSMVVDKDGIYYFHLQFRSASGWGTVATYPIKVDLTDPQFITAKITSDKETKNPNASFLFSAKDDSSGVSNFFIKLDNGEGIKIPATGTEVPYTLSNILPGDHTMLVRAVDNAGNFSSESIDFKILALDTPTITSYTEKAEINSPIIISGKTYPMSKVEILIKDADDVESKEIFVSDSSGNFNATLNTKLAEGNYRFYAKVVDSQGSQSNYTGAYKILVIPPKLMTLLLGFLRWMSICLIGILIFAGVSGLLWYAFYRLYLLRKKKVPSIASFLPSPQAIPVQQPQYQAQVSPYGETQKLAEQIASIVGKISEHHETLLEKSKERELTTEEKSFVQNFNTFGNRLVSIENPRNPY